MAVALERTPMCEATGLPLPIVGGDIRLNSFKNIDSNWHHSFHKQRRPELLTMAGLALRNSRIQLVNRGLHIVYHQIFEDGPDLSDLDDDKAFRLSVLAAAGVVPRQAVELNSDGTYKIINLDDRQHASLSDPRTMRVDDPARLATFFAYYTARQEVPELLEEGYISEFLRPPAVLLPGEFDGKTPKHVKGEAIRRRRVEEARWKKELGGYILEKTLTHSVEPLIGAFDELRQEGFMPRLRDGKHRTPYAITRRLIRQHGNLHGALAHKFNQAA